MEFGVFFTLQSAECRAAQDIFQNGFDLIQAAESLGFSRAFLAEHHFSNYSYSSNPWLLLAKLSSLTKTIRLGTAIVPVPLHHPLLTAENCAMLDNLSNGRIELGLGKGYQDYQYQRLGIKEQKDPKAFIEAVEIILMALKGKPFAYSGEYFNLSETLIYPRALQQNIPTWLVVNTKIQASIEMALKNGMNIFTGVLEPLSNLTNIFNEYPQLFEKYRKPQWIGTQRPVFISKDKNKIQKAIEHAKWNARVSVNMRYKLAGVKNGVALATPFANEPSDAEIQKVFALIGTPDHCIKQLLTLQEGLGINYFSASFSFGELPFDWIEESMQLFAEEIIPLFK